MKRSDRGSQIKIDDHLHIRAWSGDREKWKKAAERDRISLSEWVTLLLNRVAKSKRPLSSWLALFDRAEAAKQKRAAA